MSALLYDCLSGLASGMLSIYQISNKIKQSIGTSGSTQLSTVYGYLKNYVDDGITEYDNQFIPFIQMSQDLKTAILEGDPIDIPIVQNTVVVNSYVQGAQTSLDDENSGEQQQIKVFIGTDQQWQNFQKQPGVTYVVFIKA